MIKKALRALTVVAWFLPLTSFREWGITIGLLAMTIGKPQLSTISVFCTLLAVMALMLRGVDFAIDCAGHLPPVGLDGKKISSSNHVTVYVPTRDVPEYVNALASIETSYGIYRRNSSLSPQSGLPWLDLVLLDVGSIVPIEKESLGKARVERINASGDSSTPIFNAWEHIARTATSERIMWFDADVLIPKTFNWPLYLQGAWFFKKEFRHYSACFSVQREALVEMVGRLRAIPHLYTASMRWSTQDDKLVIYAMNLQKALDELSYFKHIYTQTWQRFLARSSWKDTEKVADRYLLEWNRRSDPPSGFTATIHGPLSNRMLRAVLRGYGVWSILDLVLLIQMHLVPPHGHVKSSIRFLANSIYYVERKMPAWVQDWCHEYLPRTDALFNILVDSGSVVLIFGLLISASALLKQLCLRKVVRSIA